MLEFNNFDSIRIGIASPEKIREWSFGEVKKPETINYRTLKPEKEGLFCEKIFGPTKDWECNCGKYKRIRYKGVVCDKCGVEITKSSVRRERMGHIELAAPVSHIWYFRGIPSKMGILLNISPKSLEKILYFASYIVLEEGQTTLTKYQILPEAEYAEMREQYGNRFRAGMGAEAIKELLLELDLDELAEELRETVENSTGQKRSKAIRRLDVVESFRKSGNKPEWMILDAVPVIPPDIRPMVQLDGGRFAASDLNDLYRRVINRNNRLKRLLDLKAPEIIIKNEKRMLQESVDALIDNGRRGRPVTGPGKRPLKSLSDMLKGKQGRFRQNLLGKRVDYSGRSVIVVGPELKFYQCGLPKKMALELFKPFVMRKLVADGICHNIKIAKKAVERERPEVWDVVEEVIKEHPVLLNRAPTLHRLGIQAFEPVLVEGKAIKLHPLVCTAYNADFDGDQMAVHVPLSVEAQAEAKFLMLSINNILAPKDGKPITTPTQDMVLGSYYMTIEKSEPQVGDGSIFKDYDEMVMAYENQRVTLHSRVSIRMKPEGTDEAKLVSSTVGRFIFNKQVPQDIGLINRDKDKYSLEVDRLVTKKVLEEIIAKTFEEKGNAETAVMLDNIKNAGFKFSTKGSITIGMSDMIIPENKFDIIGEAQQQVDKYQAAFRRGMISDEERLEKIIEIWRDTTDEVTEALEAAMDPLNNLYIMSHSGARGNIKQIRQIGGMRGLMASATGRTVEVPITSNFREGLNILEYFISTTGARKGSADTAIRTADSGYLTRRLVDVTQDVIIREKDCGTTEGIEVFDIKEGNEIIEEFFERLIGRYPTEDILDGNTILCKRDDVITEKIARSIIEAGITRMKVRSVLTCETEQGLCSKCYGINLADGRSVNVGESVGIIAAQSIGEPGTQLTMRTFHSGGVAGTDITQGLPRVEEVFELRKPKGLALIAKISGTVSIRETGRKRELVITGDDGDEDVSQIVFGSKVRFKEGDYVNKGDQLTDGSLYPAEILSITGVSGVENYIVKEVQKVYRAQGVDINDKHIEIVVKQMLSKVKITEAGDTEFIPGTNENYMHFLKTNKRMEKEGKIPAEGERIILGITKASLSTDSFLSAASFMETTRVLTEASIKGKVDKLIGLKENVIIGKLIPAGTGISKYKNIEITQNRTEDINIKEDVQPIL